MARGNSGENEGIQRKIVSKLRVFYLKSPGSYERDMVKNKFYGIYCNQSSKAPTSHQKRDHRDHFHTQDLLLSQDLW